MSRTLGKCESCGKRRLLMCELCVECERIEDEIARLDSEMAGQDSSMTDRAEAPELLWCAPSVSVVFYEQSELAEHPTPDDLVEYIRADLARPPQDLIEEALDYLPEDDEVTRIEDDGYGGKVYIAPMTERSWLVLQRVLAWMKELDNE